EKAVEDLTLGCGVSTRDGVLLGWIAAVKEDLLCVRPVDGGWLWLSRRSVSRIRHQSVTLAYALAELDRHAISRASRPPVSDDPVTGGASTGWPYQTQREQG